MGFLGGLFTSFVTFGLYDPYQRDIPEQHGGNRELCESGEEEDHQRKMEQGKFQEEHEQQEGA